MTVADALGIPEREPTRSAIAALSLRLLVHCGSRVASDVVGAPRSAPGGGVSCGRIVRVWKTSVPVALYRLTGGRVFGRVGGQPVLLLQTMGRRTGRWRSTPVQYLRDGESFVVVAANGGAVRPPAWLLNLRSDPHARVQLGAETREVIAREAAAGEYALLWGRLTAENRSLDKVARRAGRRLPILVLSRAGKASE